MGDGEKSGNIDQTNDILQLVTFNLGDELYAVDILNIQSINRKIEITIIPNTPDFVEGIINLRGQVIPIISLRKRFGMEEKKLDKDSRFIVMEIDNKIIGFIVDSVNEVLKIESSICSPPPPLTGGIDAKYITSVAKLEDKLIIILDLRKIISKQEMEELKAL